MKLRPVTKEEALRCYAEAKREFDRVTAEASPIHTGAANPNGFADESDARDVAYSWRQAAKSLGATPNEFTEAETRNSRKLRY